VTRHQRRFTLLTRPIFPLPVTPGWSGNPSAFPLGFTPRHYWQRMPGREQVSRALTRDYTFDINRTSSSESTHNLRLRVAPPGSAPAASPRLPRSNFTVASRPRLYRPGLEFPARHEGRVRAANQPESTGF